MMDIPVILTLAFLVSYLAATDRLLAAGVTIQGGWWPPRSWHLIQLWNSRKIGGALTTLWVFSAWLYALLMLGMFPVAVYITISGLFR